MNIIIEQIPGQDPPVVRIQCSTITPEVERAAKLLRAMDKQLIGRREGKTFIVPLKEVLYLETVEGHCFFYTKSAVYESQLRLHELEEELSGFSFLRISRTVLINLKEVSSIKTEINHHLLLTLSSGEKIMVSRQYAEELKRAIGVKS